MVLELQGECDAIANEMIYLYNSKCWKLVSSLTDVKNDLIDYQRLWKYENFFLWCIWV